MVWHTPLPRAAASARLIAEHLPGTPVIEAEELIDHIPYVPSRDETPAPWRGFFDGFDEAQSAEGARTADALVARFGAVSSPSTGAPSDTHEVAVTHSYPIAWLVRHALGAPPVRWLGLDCANAALTIVEHRDGLPPALVLFNDMTHLPAELRWTGLEGATRP